MTSGEPGRRLALACTILAAAIFGATLGMTYPLLSLLLKHAGTDSITIGLNASMTSLGIVLTAPLFPWLVRRFGGWRVVVSGLIGTAVLIAGLALWRELWAWFALRFLLGFAINSLFLVSETWIVLIAQPERRGRTLGIYTSTLATGFALGPVILALSGPESPLPFLFAVGFCGVAILPMLAMRGHEPVIDEAGRLPFAALLGQTATLLAAVVVLAMFDGAILTLLPVYMVEQGLSERAAAALLTILVTGNIALQLPVGLLSDRLDRRLVLPLCALAGCLGGVGLPFALHLPLALWLLLFFWGGLTFAIYPVVLGILGGRLSGQGMLTANATLAAVWGIGGIIGPAVAGGAMDVAGPIGLPVILALLWGAIALWLGWLLLRPTPGPHRPARRAEPGYRADTADLPK